MTCQRCQSDRVLDVCGKCDDKVNLQLGDNNCHDYLPDDLGLGGGDYLRFSMCLDCGQVQGQFPVEAESMGGSG